MKPLRLKPKRRLKSLASPKTNFSTIPHSAEHKHNNNATTINNSHIGSAATAEKNSLASRIEYSVSP